MSKICLSCGRIYAPAYTEQKCCSKSCSKQHRSGKKIMEMLNRPSTRAMSEQERERRSHGIRAAVERYGNLGEPMPQIKMEVTPWIDEQVGPFVIPTRWVRNVSDDGIG